MLLLSQNVYWFQGYPAENPSDIKLKPVVFDKLISLYKSIKPDIILLQEIQSSAIAEKTASALDMSYFYTPGEEITRYGGLALFKKDIDLRLLKPNLKIQFQRFYQLLELKNKNLILCNIHLPSDAQITEAQAIVKRREELGAIFESNQKPDILCGDFNENEFQNWPTVEFTLQQQYFDAISHNIQKNRNTKIKNKRGDYIFLKKEKQDLLKSFYTVDLEEYKSKNQDAYHLSDHFPVCIEIE